MFDLTDAMHEAERSLDLLLLDMEFPTVKNAIKTAEEARALNPNLQIIIVTAQKKYAYIAFEVRPSYYLLHSVKKKILEQEINRARKNAKPEIRKKLLIGLRNSVRYVSYKDISYIEYEKRKIHVHTAKGKVFSFTGQLSGVESKTVAYGFFRCNRSVLVNLLHVTSVDKKNSKVCLFDGQVIDISEHKVCEISAKFAAQGGVLTGGEKTRGNDRFAP
ncbi:MAG: LytTR family DNA-binding domain-containing protein [Oscillospiraceae bacterium]|jgi:DNA-binding LytR/AlgR family response regulator|nr:LytTR family DNA-binding domain-containing protein [Oscillospiraceae bacterium]